MKASFTPKETQKRSNESSLVQSLAPAKPIMEVRWGQGSWRWVPLCPLRDIHRNESGAESFNMRAACVSKVTRKLLNGKLREFEVELTRPAITRGRHVEWKATPFGLCFTQTQYT